MTLLFNVIVIGLVILIGYWWANQGFLSALLHLACVVVAGAITLAIWEPLTTAILGGGFFDNYIWGIVLLGCFAIILAVTRALSDRIVPGNLHLPNWANMTFGFVCGALAGIITTGILIIGGGFFQTADAFLYPGWGRDRDARAVIEREPKPWLPVAKWTIDFYEYTSLGSLYPNISNAPLAQQYPNLDRQASLIRDSYDEGKGQLSLAPEGADVVDAFLLDAVNNSGMPDFNDPGIQVALQSMVEILRSQGVPRNQIRVIESMMSDPNTASANFGQLPPELIAMLGQITGAASNKRFFGKPRNGERTFIVIMSFGPEAIDFGEQLTLSQAQVRLICQDTDLGPHTKAEVLFPYGWGQSVRTAPFANFIFDSQTYYMTSVPGREAATIALSFILPNNLNPEFIQVRGTRYSLDQFKTNQSGTFPVLSEFAVGTKINNAFKPSAPVGPGFGAPPTM